MGKPPFAASLVFKEIAAAVPQYAGMDYRALANVEPQWPIIGRSDMYYGGTAYDNRWGLGQQWPAAAEAGHVESYELAPEPPTAAPADGGIDILRVPALYTPGTLINRSAILHDRLARPALLLNPDDAAALMVADGAEMLTDGDGPLTVALSEDVPAGWGWCAACAATS